MPLAIGEMPSKRLIAASWQQDATIRFRPTGLDHQAKTMSLMEISQLTGVPITDIESLTQGTVTASVAERLGVPLLSLEDFLLRGFASDSVAHRLGVSMSAAEELARTVGRDGTIGILIGLLLSSADAASRHANLGSG